MRKITRLAGTVLACALAAAVAGPASATAPRPPVAVADATSTPTGTPVVIEVLANDPDPDGGLLSVTGVDLPAHGTAEVTGAGVTYRPAAGFVGDDVFTYTVANSSELTDSAVVTVTVTAPANAAPTAVADNATVEAGQTVIVPVLANDTDDDGDALTLISATDGAHGGAAVAGQYVSYSASAGFVGDDSFAYVVSDSQGATATGTVTLTVTAPPVTATNSLNVAGTVVALRASSITGQVGPVSPAPVSVDLQRNSAAGWVSVRLSPAGTSGTYAFSYVLPRRG